MTSDDVQRLFEEAGDEFLEFDRIQVPRHPRPDLCAFLLLHDLVPGRDDMVSAAGHDEIYLAVNADDLARADVTAEQVADLARCGVRLDGNDCLVMFV